MAPPPVAHPKHAKGYGLDAALVASTVLAFVALYPVVGDAVGVVSFIPTLATAWRHGRRDGLGVGLAMGLVVVPILYALCSPGFVAEDQLKNVPGLLLHLLLGGVVGYMRDLGRQLHAEIEERAAAQAALAASERQYRSLVDAMHEVVFQADSALRFSFLNPAWERTVGASAAESLGHSLFDFVFEEDRPAAVALLGALDHATAPFIRGEFRLQATDGALRWIEIHASVRADEPTHIFGTITDITDSVRFEAEREARLQTEELLRAKNVLFTTLSHEFRTPLTGILGFAELLTEETEAPHHDWAQSIAENGQRLQRTLSGILDLAMLEANEVAPDPTPTDLSEVAREVTEQFRKIAVQRGLDLRLTLPPDAPHGSIDARLLHRVLTSLLDNALKFTHQGGIDVTVGVDAGQVSIAVADTGIGIRPEFIPRLFRDFSQEREGLDRPYEGNGLGLSVTKRLVDLMGGTIDVASSPGEGSTFTVRFPLQPRSLSPRRLRSLTREA